MNKGILVTAIVWLAACVFSLFFNLKHSQSAKQDLAVQSAREVARQICLTRMWNRRHGMVYVQVTDEFKPNPFLNEKDRDVVTSEGLKLTKVNSSIMISEISELAKQQAGLQFRSTSLCPINSDNMPSAWEKDALEGFLRGKTEYARFVDVGSDSFEFRYMIPTHASPECISCHTKSGVNEGDVLGGISVTLPFKLDGTNISIWLAHVFAAIFGVIGLMFYNASQKRSELAEQVAKQLLEQANAKLSNANREMETDLVIAEGLQKHLFIDNVAPKFLEIHTKYSPLLHVSGDIIRMSENSSNGFSIFVGDGAGHGIAAAFTTIIAKVGLDEADEANSPVGQLERLNDMLEKMLPDDRYMTGIFANIRADGKMLVVNAGHPALVVLRSSGELIVKKASGLPLGLFDSDMLGLVEEEILLENGDRCFIITDGLIERMNLTGEVFGMQRFLNLILRCLPNTLDQTVAALLEDIEKFSEGRAPDDDLTIVALQFRNTGAAL